MVFVRSWPNRAAQPARPHVLGTPQRTCELRAKLEFLPLAQRGRQGVW